MASLSSRSIAYLGFGKQHHFHNSVGFLELVLEFLVLLLSEVDANGLREFEQEGHVGLVEATVVFLVLNPQANRQRMGKGNTIRRVLSGL